MSTARRNVAMASGIFAIRGHASLNELSISDPLWWFTLALSIVALGIFIDAVSGNEF